MTLVVFTCAWEVYFCTVLMKKNSLNSTGREFVFYMEISKLLGDSEDHLFATVLCVLFVTCASI